MISLARDAFASRAKLSMGRLAEIPGVSCVEPQGAFYVFPDVSAHIEGGDSGAFCEDLLEQEALAVVPGSVFRMPSHIRLSYATSIERIDGALERLGRFIGASTSGVS